MRDNKLVTRGKVKLQHISARVLETKDSLRSLRSGSFSPFPVLAWKKRRRMFSQVKRDTVSTDLLQQGPATPQQEQEAEVKVKEGCVGGGRGLVSGHVYT